MTNAENGTVLQKTLELCEAIAAQPDFLALQQRRDAFLADEALQTEYQELAEQGSSLQHRQQSGQTLDPKEITDFESKRDRFLGNPIARGFLDSQQSMHSARETITRYVTRTFELGRVPTQDDLSSCSCSSGCGGH
jgi:cell fate (sporulation/competence/biofilm development) regulator YlbF (YheA/YmcA/DUF963 family)